ARRDFHARRVIRGGTRATGGARRSRRQRARADAARRFPGAAQLGLRRRAAVRAGFVIRTPRGPEGARRRSTFARPRGAARRRLQPFRPRGKLPHAYAPQFFNPEGKTPWGAAINFDG